MSTNHRYQVMPPLSPEEYAALKMDISVNKVRIPIRVDEEDNTLDGFHRRQICEELGIDCPKEVIPGLTEAQKREYAYRMNLTRRQLTPGQKREIARTLREEGWTQEQIAQVLGVSQSTIGNWLHEFTNSGKLRQPTTVEGIDGHRYPGKKTRRRAEPPTEEANIPETPQIPSDTGARSAQALEQQEPPQPHNTPTEAQAPSLKPPVAADVPDAPERPSRVSDEWPPVPVEQASSPLGSSPVLAAEADAEGWVGALQDLAVRLETLQVQGSLLREGTRWTSDTRARGMATIRHMKEICIALEAVVGAGMSETVDRNDHEDVDATPPPVLMPIADEAQDHGNDELVTVSSAEAPFEDMSEGDQLPSQGGGEGKPPHEQVVPVQEEAKPSTPELPQAPSRPARTRTRRSKQAVENGQGSGASLQTAPDHTTPDDTPSIGEGATIGHPAPHHHEEAVEPAASTARSIDVSARNDHGHSVPGDRTRCGYCGETQFSFNSEESGKIFCKCDSVYRPSTGRWHWKRESQPPSTPASVPAMNSVMQDAIERGPREDITHSIAGGHTGINRQ